ncbi:hypothetical protein WDU94_002127 [Cyamophila willieti]
MKSLLPTKAAGLCLAAALVCLSVKSSEGVKSEAIVPCSRSDPKLSDCLLKLSPRIIAGFTELHPEFPAARIRDPQKIGTILSKTGDSSIGLSFKLTDNVLYGQKTDVVKDLKIDMKRRDLKIIIFCPRYEILCKYEMSGKVLFLPITGKGNGNITAGVDQTNQLLQMNLTQPEWDREILHIVYGIRKGLVSRVCLDLFSATMTNCDKCSLVIDSEAGYAKCLGCNKRYHFGQCSVSSSTWRGKSKELKEEWRCEECRNLKNGSVSQTQAASVPGCVSPTDTLKAVMDAAIQELSSLQEQKHSSLKATLKSYTNSCYSGLLKEIQGLNGQIEELCKVVKGLAITQEKMSEENVGLKKDLLVARQRIGELELKKSCVSQLSLDTGVSDSAAAVGAAAGAGDDGGAGAGDGGGATAADSQTQHMVNFDKARKVMPYNLVASNTPVSISGGAGLKLSSHYVAQSIAKAFPNQQMGTTTVSGGMVGDNSTAAGTSSSNMQDDGWNKVQYRRMKAQNPGSKDKAVPKIGTRATEPVGGPQSLPMVKMRTPREKKSALFVSRFGPDVSSEEIEKMITYSVTLSQLKVSKIKTRYSNDYSSFHVEVLSIDLSKIDDVNIWPVGCLIKPYYGMLKPDVIVNEHVSSNSSNPSVHT